MIVHRSLYSVVISQLRKKYYSSAPGRQDTGGVFLKEKERLVGR
jgi:hypothetical protein